MIHTDRDGIRYQRRASLLWRRTFDRIVVMVPGDPDIVELTGSGVVLWDAFADPISLADLVGGIADAYGMTPDAVRRDVRPVVEDLVARGVLVRRS